MNVINDSDNITMIDIDEFRSFNGECAELSERLKRSFSERDGR